MCQLEEGTQVNLEGTHPFPQPVIPPDTPFNEKTTLSGSGTWSPDRGTWEGGYQQQKKKQAVKGRFPARSETGRSGGRSYLALGPSVGRLAVSKSQLIHPHPVPNSPSTAPPN